MAGSAAFCIIIKAIVKLVLRSMCPIRSKFVVVKRLKLLKKDNEFSPSIKTRDLISIR